MDHTNSQDLGVRYSNSDTDEENTKTFLEKEGLEQATDHTPTLKSHLKNQDPTKNTKQRKIHKSKQRASAHKESEKTIDINSVSLEKEDRKDMQVVNLSDFPLSP